MANNFELIGVEAVVQGMSSFTANINSVNGLLNKVNASTSSLSNVSLTSWGSIEKATDKAIEAITLGAGVAVAALAGLTTGVISVAASFEQNIVRVGAVTGATSNEIKDLGDTVLTVASQSRLGLSGISEAENQLARSGISLKDINNGVLKAVTDLSEASGGELGLADAAKLVSVGMNAWGISAQDVTKFTASVTAASNASAIGFSDLNSALQITAPLAVQLGISYQDLAATFGVFGEAGIKGTIAGTALKTMLVNLANPSSRAANVMKDFGIALTSSTGAMLPYPEILKNITNAFSDEAVASGRVTDEQRLQASAILFGTRSILGALAVANQGTDSFNNMRTAIANTDVAALASKMRDSLVPQLDVLNNKVQAFVIRLGQPLVQAVSNGVKSINEFLASLNPDIPKAFGEAIVAALSGQSLEAVTVRIRSLIGEPLTTFFVGLLDTFESVRSAIVGKIIPSVEVFFDTLFKGSDVVSGLSSSFSNVHKTVEQIADDFQTVLGIFTTVIGHLREMTEASQTITIVLQTLASLPFAAVAIAFSGIALQVGAAAVQAIALSIAVRGIITVVQQVTSQWNGSFQSIIDSVSSLSAEVQTLGVVVTIVAATITGLFIQRGLIAATLAIRILYDNIVQLVVGVISLLGPLAAVAALFLGYEIVTGHVNDLVAAFNKLTPALKAVAVAALLVTTILAVNFAITAVTSVVAGIQEIIIAITALDVAISSIIVLVGAVIIEFAPVLLIVAAVIAVIAGLYLAWQSDFLGIREITASVFNEIVKVLEAIVVPFLVVIAILVQAVEGMIALWNADFLGIKTTVTNIFNDIQGILTGNATTMNNTFGTFGAIVGVFVDLFASLFNQPKVTMDQFQTNMVEAFVAVANIFGPFIDAVNILSGAWDDDFDGIRTTTVQVFNDIIKAFNDFLAELEKIPAVKQALDQLGVTALNLQNSWNGVGPSVQGIGDKVQAFIQGILAGLPVVDAQVARTASGIASLIAFANDTGYSTSNYGGQQLRSPPSPPLNIPIGVPDPSAFTDPAKAKKAADNTKELAAAFEKLLAVLPGNVKALSEYLAGLAHIDGSRFQPMVDALLAARNILEQVNASFAHLLVLNQQIQEVQSQINKIQAANSAIDLTAKKQSLGLVSQQNALSLEALQIQAQLLPIQQQIAAVDKQISDLQRTNLDTERELLQLQIQALPIQQNISALDQQISDAQRENYQNTYDTAVLNRDSLPIRQQIADLETKINRTVDQRSTLLKRQQEILAQQSVDSLTQQLDSTQTQLDAAWTNMNVPQILALEAQKDSLTNSVTTAQDQLTSIQDAQKTQSENEELAQIQLKLQEQGLIDIANSYDDQLTLLKNQKDQYDANQAVIIADLQGQKQAQEDLLRPITDQITQINNTKAAQDLQNQLAINGLEQQKRALEDLAAPMEAQLVAIQNQQAAIQNQIDTINAMATIQKEQNDAALIDAQESLANLQAEKQSEQERFDNLVIGFANAIAASGAFSTQEAIEVATRLGYGDSEIANIGQIADAYNITLVQAAENASDAVKSIPTDITVHIHFSVDSLPSLPSYEYGGTIPGPIGQPQLVIAHGGEHFMGVGNPPPPLFTQASASHTANTINNYTYEVNATYQQPQTTATVALDLRAVIAMSKR